MRRGRVRCASQSRGPRHGRGTASDPVTHVVGQLHAHAGRWADIFPACPSICLRGRWSMRACSTRCRPRLRDPPRRGGGGLESRLRLRFHEECWGRSQVSSFLTALFVLRRRWSEDILRSGLHACGRLNPKYARVLLVANILRRVSASRRRRNASGTQDTRSQGHTHATTSNTAKRGPATAHPRAAVRSRATSLL